MSVGEHFLPFCRRWATFVAKTPEILATHPRRRLCYISSIDDRNEASSRPMYIQTQMRAPFMGKESRRYYNNSVGGGGDDESGDLKEQKSAFLRALEGDRNKKRNREGGQNKASDAKSTKTRVQTRETKTENGAKSRRRSNRSDSSTTTSARTKKLTLDEFFSNLEKQKTEEISSRPATRKRSRIRVSSKKGKDEKRQLPSQQDHSNRKFQAAPAANIDSFFDEVNTLMGRKGKEQEERRRTKPIPLTRDIHPVASNSNFRASISDIIPSRTSTMNDSSENYDIGYNCSIESWDRYTELLDEVIEGPKFLARFHSKKNENKSVDDAEKNRQIVQVVEWLRSEKPLVETRLPTLDFALTGETLDRREESGNEVEASSEGETTRTGEGVYTTRRKLFREELNIQKESFVNEMNWTKKQYEVATGALVAMGNLCAKNCIAPPLDVAWLKLKELGYPMKNKDVLHNYLYVASTFSLPKRISPLAGGRFGTEDVVGDESSLSVLDFLSGTSDLSSSISSDEYSRDEIDLSAEVALCHDFLHEATEQSTGIHVRRLVQLGKANEAEALLEATVKSDDLRLRTYAPVYQTYLDKGDVSSAFKLFVKMKERKNVTLQTETYIQLIACIAENGFFRTDSKEIEGIKELPYSTKFGPELFDSLVSELAEHSIEVTSASAKRLYNAFQRGFRGGDAGKNLRPLHLLESLRIENDAAEPDELIVSRVRLDESTGKCPRSGSQLRLINLDAVQKERFQEALLYLVSSSYNERHRNATRTDVSVNLRKFGEWLQNRKGKPFTAIIDGPNIAYYMQNFEQGTFNYHQIKFVVDALEDMGESVLVVLPKKYTFDRFSISKGTHTVKQTLSQEEKEIRDDLISGGKACVVPVGSLDDYYWMYASVSMNEEFIPPDNPEQRWPGNRPMLISNDKLRDHKISLLEPRLFRRWYSNFLINFTFSAFVNDECIDREIGFKTADFYSREIQGNSSGQKGTTWHFPVSDWDENESLCIRIPQERL